MGCLIVLGWKHSEVFPVQWFHAEAQQYDDWWPHKTNKDKDILNIPDYYFLNSTAEFPTWEQICPSTPAVPNYVLLASWKPRPGTSEHRWITIIESQQGLGWNRPERLFGSNKWPNRSWYHSSTQDGAANSSRNSGEIKEESLFSHIPSLLQTFDALMFHAKHHCWQGEHPGWSREGTGHRVEQRQQFLLMCFRKTFFFPNPNLILIYILKHEVISHPIFFLLPFTQKGWVLFWVDFCLNLSCSNSSCIFNYWHRLRHWILALSNTPWQGALWINKGETIPCFLWSAMLKLHS